MMTEAEIRLAEEVGEATQEVICTHLKTWAMSVDLLNAEVRARAFLKKRFGPDPVSQRCCGRVNEHGIHLNEVILGNTDPEVTG